MQGVTLQPGDGPLSAVFLQWKERCRGVSTLTDLAHPPLRLQILGIVGKGGLGEDTHLLMSDSQFWMKMDVTDSIKELIKDETYSANDIVEITQTHGGIHNVLIVSFSPIVLNQDSGPESFLHLLFRARW